MEVDAALASGATDGGIMAGSFVSGMNTKEKRRASYKPVAPGGNDADQALIKLEAHCTAPGNRTCLKQTDGQRAVRLTGVRFFSHPGP